MSHVMEVDRQIGEQIDHWSCGIKVEGEITKIQKDGVWTKHVPVQWGNEKFTETFVTWGMVVKLN